LSAPAGFEFPLFYLGGSIGQNIWEEASEKKKGGSIGEKKSRRKHRRKKSRRKHRRNKSGRKHRGKITGRKHQGILRGSIQESWEEACVKCEEEAFIIPGGSMERILGGSIGVTSN